MGPPPRRLNRLLREWDHLPAAGAEAEVTFQNQSIQLLTSKPPELSGNTAGALTTNEPTRRGVQSLGNVDTRELSVLAADLTDFTPQNPVANRPEIADHVVGSAI